METFSDVRAGVKLGVKFDFDTVGLERLVAVMVMVAHVVVVRPC